MLVLTLYYGGDDSFRVGDTQVKLMEMHSSLKFKLRVMKKGMHEEYWITDKKATMIIRNVKVSAGHKANPGTVKVAIEAPPNIVIDREKIWQAKQDAKK